MKQRRQKRVWKECRDCSRCTDLAHGPSMLGVHCGGSTFGSDTSVSSRYLVTNTNTQGCARFPHHLRQLYITTWAHQALAQVPQGQTAVCNTQNTLCLWSLQALSFVAQPAHSAGLGNKDFNSC